MKPIAIRIETVQHSETADIAAALVRVADKITPGKGSGIFRGPSVLDYAGRPFLALEVVGEEEQLSGVTSRGRVQRVEEFGRANLVRDMHEWLQRHAAKQPAVVNVHQLTSVSTLVVFEMDA